MDGNPLQDLRPLARPRGVVVRGRWLDRAALDAILEQVAARTSPDPFAGLPPLDGGGPVRGIVDVTWKGVAVGAERYAALPSPSGPPALTAHAVDLTEHATTTLVTTPDGRVTLAGAGPKGSARLEATRTGHSLAVAGTTGTGKPVAWREERVPSNLVVVSSDLLTGLAPLTRGLTALRPGEHVTREVLDLSLRGESGATRDTWEVTRVADLEAGTRCHRVSAPKPHPRAFLLCVDPNDWPVSLEMAAFGDTLRFTRR